MKVFISHQKRDREEANFWEKKLKVEVLLFLFYEGRRFENSFWENFFKGQRY